MGMMGIPCIEILLESQTNCQCQVCSGEKASQWQLAVEILHQMHFVSLSANAAWQLKFVTSLPLAEERATKNLVVFY